MQITALEFFTNTHTTFNIYQQETVYIIHLTHIKIITDSLPFITYNMASNSF